MTIREAMLVLWRDAREHGWRDLELIYGNSVVRLGWDEIDRTAAAIRRLENGGPNAENNP